MLSRLVDWNLPSLAGLLVNETEYIQYRAECFSEPAIIGLVEFENWVQSQSLRWFGLDSLERFGLDWTGLGCM